MYETLALVGATGAVGRIVLEQLSQRQFPLKRLKLLASERSVGKEVRFGSETLKVELLEPGAFKNIDLVIASTPDEVSQEFAPWAVDAGAVVVDESGYWRMDPKVPLVVPEVNPEAVDDHRGHCRQSELQHDADGGRTGAAARSGSRPSRHRQHVPGDQRCGDLGQRRTEATACAGALAGKTHPPRTFQHPIGFNLIPQIGSEKHEGYTSEEMKMVYETRKILGDEEIQVCPTCVRVPVTIGHSESILVETERPLSLDEARQLFEQAEGVTVVDDLNERRYPMPRDCDGKDDVFVGRIRRDISSGNGIAFWCVSDNLRKGAATNAVQIAELLVRRAAAVGEKS